jgi:para-aminobenzoate synthetase component 1
VIVKQFKQQANLSIKNMLHQLQNCHGLFFISKNNCKVIGLMPKWRLIKLNTDHFIEEKREVLTYQKKQKNTDFASTLLNFWQGAHQDHHKLTSSDAAMFGGGLMGFMGYDFYNPSTQAAKAKSSPLATFAEYDIFLRLESNHWCLYGPDEATLQPIYDYIKSLMMMPPNQDTRFKVKEPFKPVWDYQQYESAFNQIQAYLKQGDCYQVNLTQPYKAIVKGNVLATLDDLLALTKASFAGYMAYEDFELLSCSPELFIDFKPNHEFVTRPIKGTQPRHADTDTDQSNKQTLINSEKDRSENLMIVDLLRNDFSKHAVTGSVQVSKLFEIESFAQVHHMVSEIKATLKPDISPLEVLFSAFPGGSITGAPKIRAMQIIDELEAESRGAYCGSIGYLNYNNTGSFNILIRTLQRHAEVLTAWAGGGITIASTCDAEYQECSDKIKAILDCVNQYSQSND